MRFFFEAGREEDYDIMQIQAPVFDFDFFDPRILADPYQHDSDLRETSPVVWIPAYKTYAASRHNDVRAILSDWRSFSSRVRPFSLDRTPVSQILVADDPPNHTAVRAALNGFVSPTALAAAEKGFIETAEEVVSEFLDKRDFDAFDLASRFVLKAFPDYLGLPPDGRENLLPFGEALFNCFGPMNELAKASLERAENAFGWVEENCQRSVVAPGRLADQIYSLSDSGVVADADAAELVRSVLSAGFDTTILTLTAAIYYPAGDPSIWSHAEDPKYRRRLFEETLRIEPPARWVGRVVKERAIISGVEFAEGDNILLLLTSAGRDPRKWESPDAFSINRTNAGHLGFGYGIHACVGQVLARLEFEVLFAVLRKRARLLQRNGTPSRIINNTTNGWKSVPVRLIAA